MRGGTSVGGVEEKKDESGDSITMMYHHQRQISESMEHHNDAEEQNHGFQAQMAGFAKLIFGSCGSALEAASFFARGQGCRWPASPTQTHGGGPVSKPPLSIADELRRLAAMEGREFNPTPLTAGQADIPQFLGEEDMRSFEDDNISALSQHTLEELARGARAQQQVVRMSRISSSQSQEPPSPTRTRSRSRSSEDSRYGRKREERKSRR